MESEEIFEAYPKAKDKELMISIAFLVQHGNPCPPGKVRVQRFYR